MNKLVVTSMSQDAGKTSLIAGIAKALGDKFEVGYLKPLGDRLLYRKKQLWDHDSAVIAHHFGLTTPPELMNLGFDHAKLRYMYNRAGISEKLRAGADQVGAGKDLLLVESGKDVTYGISVNLDAVFVAEQIGGKLVIILSGNEDSMMDDLVFAKRYFDSTGVDFGGVVLNKLHDAAGFESSYRSLIEEMGVNVLGIIPHQPALTTFSLDYLAERLFAKVLAGEERLKTHVQNIFVGAMSVDAALRNPALTQENNLMITSGDRTDMILAALEGNTVGIVLTNNILPPSNIVAKAAKHNIVLLQVTKDTYEIAKQIDELQPLLTVADTARVELLGNLVQTHVNLDSVIK